MKDWNAILFAFASNDIPAKADAIVLLEGDGIARVKKAAELFRLGFAKAVVISGSAIHAPRFTVPAREISLYLYRKGVPRSSIVLEDGSQNTREQGLAIVRLAKKRKWKRIMLVASLFHQPRAYLTFLQAMNEVGYRLFIINTPARDLPWFKKVATGKTRLELLHDEFAKIRVYRKKGHVATASEVLRYERWRERQR